MTQTTVQQDAARAQFEARLAAEQASLAALALTDLQNRYAKQSPMQPLTLGGGIAEVLLPGNPGDTFHGISILNPSPMNLHLNFSGNASSAPLTVGPGNQLVLPVEYKDVSIWVNETDAARTAAQIIVQRMWFPPAQAATADFGPSDGLWNPLTQIPEAQRTPTVWLPVQATLVAKTPTAIWTPAAGKRFRLLGYSLGLGTTTSYAVQLRDGASASGFHQILLTKANAPVTTPAGWGNGYLSTTAANALNLYSEGTPEVVGSILGCEE